MPGEDASPIIIFLISFYAFAIVLLYVLARAWSQALSTRPDPSGKPSNSSNSSWKAEGRPAAVGDGAEAVSLKAMSGDARNSER